METYEAVIANTRVDRHGESISVDALRELASGLEDFYIPIDIEHDPRIPPVGRLHSAYVRLNEAGDFEAVGTLEIFDSAIPDLAESTREIRLRNIDCGKIHIEYDRNYQNPSDETLLKNLAAATDAHLGFVGKKSLDPLSVLCISAGIFVLGGIAKGFFSKLGGDSYELLKAKLREIFSRQKEGEKEKLLELEFSVQHGQETFHVAIIVTNPSGSEIDDLLDKHLEQLDKSVISAFDRRAGLKKLVYQVQDGNLTLSFGVRRDCVPLIPKPVDSPQVVEPEIPQANAKVP